MTVGFYTIIIKYAFFLYMETNFSLSLDRSIVEDEFDHYWQPLLENDCRRSQQTISLVLLILAMKIILTIDIHQLLGLSSLRECRGQNRHQVSPPQRHQSSKRGQPRGNPGVQKWDQELLMLEGASVGCAGCINSQPIRHSDET